MIGGPTVYGGRGCLAATRTPRARDATPRALGAKYAATTEFDGWGYVQLHDATHPNCRSSNRTQSRRPWTSASPLAGLRALHQLNLEGTRVRDVAPPAGLALLEELVLASTPVADISPLTDLSRLRLLQLQHTQVSDLTPLIGLSELLAVNLRGTPVGDDQVAALQRAHSQLSIARS